MRTTSALFPFVVMMAVPLSARLSAQTSADTASVRAFFGEWFSSAAQSPERYASFYAEDGRVLPPNKPPATGRAAIAEWWRQSQAESPWTVRPERITEDEMRFMGSDWVVYRGTLGGQRIPRAGGAAVPFETKYFDLLHRRADGRWEVVYRMWSDNR